MSRCGAAAPSRCRSSGLPAGSSATTPGIPARTWTRRRRRPPRPSSPDGSRRAFQLPFPPLARLSTSSGLAAHLARPWRLGLVLVRKGGFAVARLRRRRRRRVEGRPAARAGQDEGRRLVAAAVRPASRQPGPGGVRRGVRLRRARSCCRTPRDLDLMVTAGDQAGGRRRLRLPRARAVARRRAALACGVAGSDARCARHRPIAAARSSRRDGPRHHPLRPASLAMCDPTLRRTLHGVCGQQGVGGEGVAVAHV